MNLHKNKWIWIKAVLILASAVAVGLVDPGDPDPTSYLFVATMPLVFFALCLPLFMRQCETTLRYSTQMDVWRAHPFFVGSGSLPFYHFGAWSSLVAGSIAAPIALLGGRDLGTAFFMLSAGAGCLIGVQRTLKRNMKDVEQSAPPLPSEGAPSEGR